MFDCLFEECNGPAMPHFRPSNILLLPIEVGLQRVRVVVFFFTVIRQNICSNEYTHCNDFSWSIWQLSSRQRTISIDIFFHEARYNYSPNERSLPLHLRSLLDILILQLIRVSLEATQAQVPLRVLEEVIKARGGGFLYV